MRKFRTLFISFFCLVMLLFSALPLQTYAKRSTSYPSAFDLRKLHGVTAVRDQKDAGLCWAFAATSAMESNALMHGFGTYDLSEVHLAYFSLTGVANPLPGLEGDTITFRGNKPWYQYGGYSGFATMFLMNGYGAVLESDAPLSMLPSSPSQSLATGHAVLNLIGTREVSASDRSSVKQLIMTEGAVVCGTHFSKKQSTYFHTGTNALFVNKKLPLDHDITLIGWDDNYSRNNFGKYKPKKNGAWLCKNCWGKNWGDEGYFWLSYEDVPSSGDLCYSYLVEKANPMVHLYQHDGGYALYGYENTLSMANVFTASTDEVLRSVSCYLEKAAGTISIYIGGQKNAPLSGKKVSTQRFFTSYCGYHSFPLHNKIALSNGTRFTVVFTFDKPAFAYTDYDDDGDWYITSDITAKSGQSYVKLTDADWFTDSSWNLRIKAYAVQ